MRRLIVMFLALALFVGAALPASAATGTPIVLDDQPTTVTMDTETGFVALDQFAKAVGAQYTWVAERREASVVLGHRSIILWADSPRAVLSGTVRTLAAAPSLSGNTLLAPARAVAEALGLYVAGDKDGTLVLQTGLGLIQNTIAPDFAADQIMSASTHMSMLVNHPTNPEESESLSFSMEQAMHKYQEDLMLKIHMALPLETPATIELAYIDGKSYMKEPSKGWVMTGETAPPMDLFSMQFGELWTEAVQPGNPELEDAVVTVLGTSEMDGVKVVNVMISMTESEFMPAMGTIMGLDDAQEEEGVVVDIRRYTQTYAINPETGLVHEAVTELHMFASDRIGVTLESKVSGSMRVSPVSVPIELPADFPR